MPEDRRVILETERLVVRAATLEDAGLYLSLWTNPQVMGNVGFPNGLPIARLEIEARLRDQGDAVFDRLLVVQCRETGERIGECKMSLPDEEGVAATDVKLLPPFWGRRYGVEVKRGLVDYLFTHTDCQVVEATPNVENVASIRMQEAVGGVRVGEGVFEFPPSMQAYTRPVHHYVYRVYRSSWQAGGKGEVS
jgi:RimJ/RimL family protein N-acetyltransferase